MRIFSLSRLLAGFLLAGFFTSQVAGLAQGAEPITWQVAEKSIAAKPRATVKLRVIARMDAGWHVYSMKETPGGPKPTRFTVDAPARLTGRVEAPDPLVAEDRNFPGEVEYYEESAEFVVPVTLPAELPARIVLRVRYQSCTEKECLPPRTVELPVAIRP